jgi:hypothetical protein
MSKPLDVASAQLIADIGDFNVVIIHAWSHGNIRGQRVTYGRTPANKDWAVVVADRMDEGIGMGDDTAAQFVEDFRAPSEAAVGKGALDIVRKLYLNHGIALEHRREVEEFLRRHSPETVEVQRGESKEDRIPPY